MSQRRLPTGVRPLPQSIPVSDKSKLLWERYYKHMQAAAQAMNLAVQNTENLLGTIIIEAEGYSTDTHVFDMSAVAIVPRPKKPENGA